MRHTWADTCGCRDATSLLSSHGSPRARASKDGWARSPGRHLMTSLRTWFSPFPHMHTPRYLLWRLHASCHAPEGPGVTHALFVGSKHSFPGTRRAAAVDWEPWSRGERSLCGACSLSEWNEVKSNLKSSKITCNLETINQNLCLAASHKIRRENVLEKSIGYQHYYIKHLNVVKFINTHFILYFALQNYFVGTKMDFCFFSFSIFCTSVS